MALPSFERPSRPCSGPRRPSAAAACALALVVTAVDCTFVVSSDSTKQCTFTQDCVARGGAFAQSTCSADGVCVPSVEPVEVKCEDSASCVAAKGPNYVCRKSDQSCVSLLSEECTLVEGNSSLDDVVLLGSILPTTGELADSVGKPLENAVRMAIGEFATIGGLPLLGSGKSRPLVLVGCSDGNAPATAVAAAKHLKELGVQIIVGAYSTESTLAVANEVTIQSKIMLLSPGATGVELASNFNDFGFVWRTAPSDAFHANALSALVTFFEPQIVAALPAPAPLKVATLYRTDDYGRVIKGGFESEVRFNNKTTSDNGTDYVAVPYGDPSNPSGSDPPKYQIASKQVVDAVPHLVTIVGREEATSLLGRIESQWPVAADAPPRPFYLLTDGVTSAALPGEVDNPDLRRRVFGTVLGSDDAEFNSYRFNYLSKYPPPFHPFAANAYDATYMIAYSVVAAGTSALTGQTFVGSFAKLVPQGTNPAVLAGPTGIGDAFGALSGGATINLNGTSGPLDFSTQLGEAFSDVQVYCAVTGALAAPSGLYFDAASRTLKGAINPESCQ
jgi:ABC-type branched-subunit amino acid transport system substrate-binding protein